jgi:hypothetical protein
MILSPVRAKFDAVLREQHLADDFAAFADPAYFDETALYSRYRQIDFLRQYGDLNLLLIELSLDYLDRVTTAMRADQITRFAAITIISDDGGKHIVPQIFVCNGDVRHRLANLSLSGPSSDLGMQVADLVGQARPEGFDVFEDRTTVAGDVRVFVGHRFPPQGFAALADFAAARTAQEARPVDIIEGK